MCPHRGRISVHTQVHGRDSPRSARGGTALEVDTGHTGGVKHNAAVSLFGRCPCVCHAVRTPAARSLCWCTPARSRSADVTELNELELAALRVSAKRVGAWVDEPRIAHNDAVRVLGACPDRSHVDRTAPRGCAGRTDPVVERILQGKEEQDLRHRLRTGRATTREYLTHAPHILQGQVVRRDR